MIPNVGYNDKTFFGSGLNALTRFDGKYLKDADGLVSGYFITPLKNGKSILTEYKNGLLKSASLNINGITRQKTYSYNADGKLLNVKQDGEDVFVKDCGYVDSDTISYYETINGGKIEIGYNSKHQKIASVIKPKLLRSIFIDLGNKFIEKRYKITNAETDGQHFWVYPSKNPNNDPYDLDMDFLKKLERDKTTGSTTVTTIEMKNTTKLVEKDKDGKIISIVRTAFNDKARPTWIKETDAVGNILFERKITYAKDNETMLNEFIYDAKTKALPYYQETTYYKGKYVLISRLYDADKKLQATHHNTYSDFGKVLKSEVRNAKGKVLERETFKYDKNQNLIFSHYTGTDKDSILEGYYRYQNGRITYEKEIYENTIEETHYDRFFNPKRFTIKDLNGKLIKAYVHTYKNGNLKKTECQNSEGKVFFNIYHKIREFGDAKIHDKVFKDPNGKFLFLEEITYKSNDVNYAYYDINGDSIPAYDYLKYINY